MKKILLLATALVLWACHEDIATSDGNRGDVLTLNAEISQQYVTRANDGGFTDGDQIGVFVVNRDNGESQPLKVSGNHADNVRFTYNANDGKWTGSYQLYWKDKNTHVDAYGYYPFDAELASVEAYPFTIQRNQHETVTQKTIGGYEASDFLWAKAEDVASGVPITLKHHHVMAGIEVTLVEGDGFDDGEWAGLEKSVLVSNTTLVTTVNLSTGTVALAGSDVETIIPQQSGTVWRAVVAPQVVAADKALLAITVNGICHDFLRATDMQYYPGRLHRFTLKVDKSLPKGDYVFSLLTESITPWESDAESHNGKAREYIVVHVNELQYLGDVIDSLGLDPSKIINLKITGYLGKSIQWVDGETGTAHYYSGSRHFDYIRENMTNLEAINLKDVVKFNGPAGGDNLSWRQIIDNANDGTWNPYEQDVDNFDGCLPAGAFENMSTLKYFTWPDHLEAIGNQAFPGTNLTGSLILPEGLVYVGGGAFMAYQHKAASLTGELYIPSTVEFIGDGAFGSNDGNDNMFYFTNELILPSKMKYLGTNAFGGCPYMTGTIHVPDGIDEMNNAWPKQISGSCVIPQGVKRINSIPWGAMGNVIVPEGVEEIANEAFQGHPYLRNVMLPSTLKTIGVRCFDYSSITHINLPEGLEVIEDVTFNGCGNLQDTITIPSTVIQIRNSAFAECRQLTAVILPAGLQGIQSRAFANCFSLDYIQCLGSEPPTIEEDTFSGVEKDNFTVVVPEGAVEAYKNAPYWSEFKRISAYRNFVCRPMKAKLLNKSNVRDVVLNADAGWTVKSAPSWAHVDKTSGTKKTELKVTIDAMPHNQGDREGAIVFQLDRNDENGDPITCTYTIQQFDYEYEEDGVISLQKATKGSRGGIDILFVGDGYDAEDIAKGTYRTDMEQEMEYFFGVEPYKTYRDYFNVSAAVAMSNESGVVDSPDKWRNTKFEVAWGTGADGRLSVPFDKIGSYVLTEVTDCPITTANVGRSLIICVPNSNAYEGLTAMYADGSAIAVCPMSKLDYPYDARGLIQHEAGGHGWAKLDDEYIYHRDYIQRCTCICCSHVDGVESMHAMGWGRNLSLNGKYKEVPWQHIIYDARYSDICDIYEGGHMHAQGIYRSELNSCMNNNVPYFSTWSRQLIVERIMEASGGTFDYETFVSKDSRDYGEKFLTRSLLETPWQQVKAAHSEHHHPIIKQGSITDYIKKGGRK